MLEKELADDIADYMARKGFYSMIKDFYNGYVVLSARQITIPLSANPYMREGAQRFMEFIAIESYEKWGSFLIRNLE